MKKLVSSLIAALVCATSLAQNLDEKIGQLLVVGFVGMEPSSGVIEAVEKYKVGGIILFDKNVSNKLPRGGYAQRNIESPKQLKALTCSLQTIAAEAKLPKLFIAIDQEGGLINRLKGSYGFPSTVSAAYQGKINRDDTTRRYAQQTASTLVKSGININFAPCTDLAVNPANPIIAKVERAFSATSDGVTRHARIWIDELNKAGLITSIKHFPGHGSSRDDSHLGLPDVSATWIEDEIVPYRTLIDEGYDDIVMIGHLVNRRFDADLPASLSAKTIDYLRDTLHYAGVVATDDMNMGAIIDNYSLPHALELAINAGVDMIIMGNNGKVFEPDLVSRTVETIKHLIAEAKISQRRIDQAYDRVMKLKKRLYQ